MPTYLFTFTGVEPRPEEIEESRAMRAVEEGNDGLRADAIIIGAGVIGAAVA